MNDEPGQGDAMDDAPSDAVNELRAAEDRLASANTLLAEWAACSAQSSPPLVERLARLGYDVRGKSREDVAEVLKHPPTRPPDALAQDASGD